MNAERKISHSVRYLYLKLQIWLSFRFSYTLLLFLLCLKTVNWLAFTFRNVSELLAVPKMLILDHLMSRAKVRWNILTHCKFSYIATNRPQFHFCKPWSPNLSTLVLMVLSESSVILLSSILKTNRFDNLR